MVSLFVVYGCPGFLLLLQHVVGISFVGRSGYGSHTAFPMNASSHAAIIFSTHGMSVIELFSDLIVRYSFLLDLKHKYS